MLAMNISEGWAPTKAKNVKTNKEVTMAEKATGKLLAPFALNSIGKRYHLLP